MYGKFSKLGTAISFSSRTKKMSAVVHGDDGKFWVVSMAKLDELTKAGYEMVA